IDIAFKRVSGAEMETADSVNVFKESGIENDCRGNSKNAQITILSLESWEDVCKEVNKNLDWKVRRVNLLIKGVNLENSTGKCLRIGNEVALKITGECKPCNRMENEVEGLYNALKSNWRGGAEAVVLTPGKIQKGDIISYIN
ncbi:MAG: MOSC domain-containing protein, partial [Candidatus Muiribacteriota bacterium]